MSKFRDLVENLNDIKQWLSQSSPIEEGDKKVFDKETGYNSSKDETYIYEKLKEKYPNIQISYTDDRFVNPETKRHFQLDFYDPDSDTGFNYNKVWTHCRRKYNPDYYKRALKQWTITDPIKREVAKANGLKFIEWFNLDEFNRWYENPELTYEEYKYAPDSVQYDSEEYFKQKARGRDIYGVDSDPYAA